MKKALALIMAVFILLTICACGAKDDSGKADSGKTDTSATDGGKNDPGSSDTDQTNDTEDNGEEFRIGLSSSFTGGTAQEGIEAKNAAEMAIAYINENGGFNGAQGVLATTYDNKGSPEEAVKAAQKLVENENVDAIIGSNSSAEMLASGQIFEDAQVFTIGMGTSATWMQQGWKYIIRCSVNYDFVADELAKMVDDMGITEMAVMKDQQEAALSFVDAFKTATAGNVNIVAEESCEVDDTDLSSQCARLVAAKPQAILLSMTSNDAGYFVKQIRQNGYTGLIFDKESYYADLAEISGWDNANYILFANPYVTYNDISECDIEVMHNFLEMYIETYGEIPRTEIGYRAWDAVMVIAEATNLAKSSDTEDMLAVVPEIKLDGLGGTMDYSNNDGEPYHNVSRFVLVESVNISWDKWFNDGGYDSYKTETGNAY